MDGWVDTWMDGCIEGWMDPWMDGWMERGREVWGEQLLSSVLNVLDGLTVSTCIPFIVNSCSSRGVLVQVLQEANTKMGY